MEPRAVPTHDSVAELSRNRGAGPRDVRGARFGVVLHREIGLSEAKFVLAVAGSCRAAPRPAAPRDVLLEIDAEAQRCRVRPYRGAVTVSLRRTDGRWLADAIMLATDREGRLRTRFADLDGVLAQRGEQLDDFTALRFGRDGWAGTYDLTRLRAVQADLHAQWIEHGRGAPALFALRHAEHPHAGRALELAVEARLARQEQDFAAVLRGELAAAAFLDRHVWSPLRHRVTAMLIEQRVRVASDDP
jgi:hypothetical protein